MADDVLNVGAAGPSYRWLAGGSIRLTRVRGVPLAGEAVTPSIPMRVPVAVFFSVSPRQQQ